MGSQIVGIPGLLEMISHNQLLYNDLQDPVGLLKGKENTNLSHFWPYVQKSRDKSDISEKNSVQYSKLMQTSQRLVAKETLDTYSLARFKNILDLGGGTGAFLSEVDKRYPQMSRTLFDLPNVIKEAKSNASKDKYLADINFIGGSFLVDTIPLGFELITLVRVLYDHEDHTAELILKRIFESLPSSGKLLITEPMSGGSNPSKSSDCYFSFYTMAMTTGKVRSFEEHKAILLRVGFSNIKKHNGSAPFITQVITAEK
jgi:demethylspheroidene O-methyltransferase